ncbi:MAG: nucleotidyltransferase family protein, partial [Chloroflexota bacterium]
AAELMDAYRFHALEAARGKRELSRAVAALQSAGLEPVLLKGLAAGRLYPELGLRPYTDLDLYVRPEWSVRAAAVVRELQRTSLPIDLHVKIADMPDRSPAALYERSRFVPLDENGLQVRVLGMEDHLRFVCLHLLRHGGRRPLWLCDVGAGLEALPGDFDAAYFMSGEPRRSAWVVAVLALARDLLGARLGQLPQARAPGVPWLERTLLRAWGGRYLPHSTLPMASSLRDPKSVVAGLRERWPSPVEATYWLDAAPDQRWPVWFQLRVYMRRALGFAASTHDHRRQLAHTD